MDRRKVAWRVDPGALGEKGVGSGRSPGGVGRPERGQHLTAPKRLRDAAEGQRARGSPSERFYVYAARDLAANERC
jgi:hypothetical protein